jgi:hypothetical protein
MASQKSFRHHSAHPPTQIKPNTAVNPKPEMYQPPAAPRNANPNPSLGIVSSPGAVTLNPLTPPKATPAPQTPAAPTELATRPGVHAANPAQRLRSDATLEDKLQELEEEAEDEADEEPEENSRRPTKIS